MIFKSAYLLKQSFGWWPMKKWGENKKKDWVEEVGEKTGGCFSYSYDCVGGAGKLLLSPSPVNVNLVIYFG